MKKVKWSFSLLFFLFSIVCFFKGAAVFSAMSDYSADVSIYNKKLDIGYEEAEKILRENKKQKDPEDMVFWTVREKETVTNPNLLRSTQTNVLFFQGRLNVLFHEFANLDSTDTKGCVLSLTLAYQLFGDSQVAGKKVTFYGRTLIVRKVLKTVKEPLLITPLSSASKELFDRVNVAKKDPLISSKTVQNRLASRFQVTGNLVDRTFFTSIAVFFVLAPLLYLSVRGISFLKRNKFSMKRTYWVVLAVSLLVWITFLLDVLPLSSEGVPSKWSDFDFFQRLWQEKQAAFEFFVRMPKQFFEMGYLHLFSSLIFWETACLFSFHFAWKNQDFIRIENTTIDPFDF